MGYALSLFISFYLFSGSTTSIHSGQVVDWAKYYKEMKRQCMSTCYQITISSKAISYVGRKSKEVCPWVPSNVACAAFTRTVIKRSTGLLFDRGSALVHWYQFMRRSRRGGAKFISKTNNLIPGDVVFYAENGYLMHTGIYVGRYCGPVGNNTGKRVAYKDAVIQNSSSEKRILSFSMREFMETQGQTFLGAVRLAHVNQ